MDHEEQNVHDMKLPGEERSAVRQEFPLQKKPQKKKIFLLGGLAFIVLVGAALLYFLVLANPSRQALAVVNGEKITVEQFNRELAKVQSPYREMYREEPTQFLDGLIVKTLLLQEAKKEGISPPLQTYKDTVKYSSPEEALVAEFMKKKFSTPPEVTRQEVETFYTTFKDRMEGKPLKEVATTIEEIIRQGKQQEAFDNFLRDLHQRAGIEIDQIRLKKIALKPPDSNTEEEFKTALQSGKPFLVDFGANSCAPCRQMRPILKEIDKEYSAKTRALVIDVYKYQNLARDYKVVLIPTLVFFDAKGKEAFRHMGVMEKDQIIAKLKEIGMAS